MIKLFWWNRVPNLGDILSGLLLTSYGYEVEWAPPETAGWIGIGSILGWFDEFAGTVWGSGRGGDDLAPNDLRLANVKALRGRETQKLVVGGNKAVLGDPALLVTDLVTPDPQGYTAVVPHFQDQERLAAMYESDVQVDVMGSVSTALEQIANADRVVSSSLHGLVLADAFGIPRKWEYFNGSLGNGFKFRDYASVMGDFEPDEWVTANPRRVESVRTELRACL